MIEYIVLTIILIYFIIASIEDIKKREVYDYINFSLAFIILSIAIFDSFIVESIDPIKYASFGMLVGFAIGAFLFYLGIWGGGDAKFILGFGAASYYLTNLVFNANIGTENAYLFVMTVLSDFLALAIAFFLKYLIIIDIIFTILIVIQFTMSKRKEERKDLIFLFSILVILFIGLYLEYEHWLLVGLGFVAFFLIFMAREGVFGSVFIKYKRALSKLKVGDKIDSDILINHKKIVDYEEGKFGLNKEDIHKIKDNLDSKNKNKDVLLRKSLPYGMLIALNFFVYILKIVILDHTNLTILSFLIKFMFFSFLAGGIIAVIVVFYYYIINHSNVKIKLTMNEKVLGICLLVASIGLYLINSKFLLLLGLIPLYFFVRMAKAIEKVAFIKKKAISEIVLGDWIVQDIKVGHKVIYHKEDFKIGVDEIQLAKIKELDKTHHNLDKILVKDGIAFLPALFLGFLLMFFI